MNLMMLSGDSSLAQGQDSTFAQMMRRFCRYWDRVDILCPHVDGVGEKEVGDNVYMHISPWNKLLQPWFIRREGRALFSERDYALVVSHDYGLFLNGFGAWLLTRGTRVPYVSEIHHVEGYPASVTQRERLYRPIAKIDIRWVSRPALAIRVVNSGEMVPLLIRLGVPTKKILVLPSLYIDFELFCPMPAERCQFDVLFVGRFAENKGLFTLLDAIALLRETRPAIRLCLVGRGPLDSAIKQRVDSLHLENVTIIPRLESALDVARTYNQARILVCASTSEGGPRVTVEAMACGIPVISTPVGVMSELLTDGVNGMVFHWDSHELAEKIRLLLEDDALAKRLGEAGRQSVQRYNADTVIDHYATSYQSLITGRGNA